MPIALEIDVDLDQVDAELRRVGRLGEARALARAVNRTARSARTFLRRSVQDVVNLRAKDVNQVVSVKRASRSSPDAVLVVARRPVPLFRYAARQGQRGTTVKVKRSGSRKLVRRGGRKAFIVTLPGGHTGVLVRSSDERLPIRELFGPSVAQVVDDAGVHAKLARHVETVFPVELERSVGVSLRR